MNKKIAIIGAGLGGISAAIMFAKNHNAEITIFEKSNKIRTEGAGILLYSNALYSLKKIGVYEQILELGFIMKGDTHVVDSNNNLIGSIKYKSIVDNIPPYIGISRQRLLDILFNESKKYNINYIFNNKLSADDLEFKSFDLIIGADGVSSTTREQRWNNTATKKYSGFCLWHILYNYKHNFVDKNLVILPGKRFGVIPLSKENMYVWASLKIENPIYENKLKNIEFFKESFGSCSGILKNLILNINLETYIHFSPVYEVSINDYWHRKNIVLLGDSAHASLPFMAQGSAMAFADAVILSNTINWDHLDLSLTQYYKIRKPMVDFVQQLSYNIGMSYQSSTIDVEKVQDNLNVFYSNKNLLT